ncbi:SDR family oxidoreductase [Arthrobacter sp. KK5.5]|uniref:SDR family oxidoreductase n=1 Tax=Arthrobacter sp. KK5.5 TaxID=3373084 RepID=UPI003EE7CE11
MTEAGTVGELTGRRVLVTGGASGIGEACVREFAGLGASVRVADLNGDDGLEGLSKVTALEGGERGVTSNCISPAYVRTPPLVERQISDQAAAHGIAESEVVAKVMLTESAVKRLVEPEEVASLAAWMASPRAGMVTGASYTMDGGWTAR